MAKEPQFPKRDLNQAAVDAIATRIDTYEQVWQRHWEESDKRWDDRMDRLLEGTDEDEGHGSDDRSESQ